MLVDAAEAARVAREVFGIDGTATPLPGERDLNFRLDAAGAAYVLKLHQADDEHSFATAALEHVAGTSGAPRLVGTGDYGDSAVSLLTWLDGRPWAECGPHDTARRESLGRAVARLDRALAGFRHPAEDRPLLWNMARASETAAFVELVAPERQDAVREIFARHKSVVVPKLAALPHQVIHNDANELNILVGEDGLVAGLIDFGDAVWSPRIAGLAVACAYSMLDERDPVRAAVPVVAGYDAEWPLRTDELEVLFDLIRLRLAMSVAMAASQHSNDPTNDYLLVSQDAVWPTLGRLAEESRDLAHFRFRDACGWDAVPWSRHVRQYFESGRARTEPVLPVDLDGPAVVLDLGPGGFDPLDPKELAAACADIEERIERAGAEFAVGLYKEDRTIYRAPQFDLGDGRRRSLHMAVDLWLAAGTPVHAALEGVAAVVANNPAPLDFGGLILLEHATDAGVPFWTLYGHLDPESLGPAVGDTVSAGDEIARLGDVPVNGGWPPHLHFQLLTSLCDQGADVPGVAAPDEASLWESISPDPNLILRRRDGDEAPLARPREEIARRRRGNLSGALSIAYREPLHIVRGEGAYLYDDAGNEYLDLVNNVAHVGHCHPRVVEAGVRQMQILNTNTRYLHDSIVRYAHRLAAAMPDPLRVVFLVNSGSEANDLALRLATAYTGRDDVLVLDHAYHGHLSSTVALSPYKFGGPGGGGKPATTLVCELPDPYRGRLRAGEADLGARYAESVLAQAEAHSPAAFIAESLPGVAGQIVFPDGYLAAAFAHVRAAGGVCIADEVQVGLGRVGEHAWGFELQGVVPDIVTLGKPIGNGHPLAAVITTPEIAASFVTGMEYFNTFGGNPVSCEIGLAVLDVVRDEGLQQNAQEIGDRMIAGLRELAGRHELVGDVRGHGLFIGVELSLDPETREPATDAAAEAKERVKTRGILISTDGPDDNVLKIKPPLVVSADDCDRFLEALDAALAETEAGIP